MNILFIIPYFYPARSFGGPVSFLLELCEELSRKHNIVVITSDAFDLSNRINYEYLKIFNDVKVVYLRNLTMLTVKYSKLFITLGLRQAISKLIDKVDVIHAHEYRTYQNVIVLKTLQNVTNKKLFILQPHGSAIYYGRVIRKILFDNLWGYKILRTASKIIALTRAEKKYLTKLGVNAEKIEIVPLGININKYDKLRHIICKQYKTVNDEAENRVLFLGRLNRIKRVDVLIKAFAIVENEIRDIKPKLIIVGPDEGELIALRKLAKKLSLRNIEFTGPLYGIRKIREICRATLLVLPSDYETFPMTILEAYAFAKPVIATDFPGVEDVVLNGKTGIIVKRGDHIKLANAIIQMLENKKIIKYMGRYGRQYLEEKFTTQKIVEKIINIYLEKQNSGSYE